MKEQEATALLEKYQRNELSPAEEQLINEWYLVQLTESNHALSSGELSATVNAIRSKLPLPGRKHRVLSWGRIAAVLALAGTLGYGVYHFSSVPQDGFRTGLAQASDIAPGRAGATLTLGNGKQLRLSELANGKVASESGMSIVKASDGRLIYMASSSADAATGEVLTNTLSTARGETYMLVLPDGSKVWLNSASSISYPSNLSRASVRTVKTEGEVYLEVTKDSTRPFLVESRGQQVRVLGTHFNINAYSDEPRTATTLLEGSIQLTTGGHSKTLIPGQMALTGNGLIAVSNSDAEKATDWKNGDFYLNHVNFRTAMRKLERWYDVEFIYDPAVPEDIEAGGWISRNQKLSAVLRLIESSGQVRFTTHGKKIYVSNNQP